MGSVQMLKVFVEIDPSHPIFSKFRISHDFYTEFCGVLLRDVLKAMPKLEAVKIAGRPSVNADGALVSRLQREVEQQGRLLKWGEIGREMSLDDETVEVAIAENDLILEDSMWTSRIVEAVSQEA